MMESADSHKQKTAPAGESLNVIALISGGKDSFFSLLHCLRNGHRVVALGNLYPPSATHGKDELKEPEKKTQVKGDVEDEKDLNSFMYQTVGHTVIPTYERLLGIPLYRQEIIGGAVQTGTSYYASSSRKSRDVDAEKEVEREGDETESLIPLLRRIMDAHPEANAVCSGAILSTYQRTRIESVALRLGLVPLAYLWQYLVLPPHTQTSLLEDMYSAGIEARIVKVASGGIDESWLWERVTDPRTLDRLERRLRKFGVDGDGAVIGEGGEYETIVVDGPANLFKARLRLERENTTVISEGGGNSWLKIDQVEVEEKEKTTDLECRVPAVLEARFESLLKGREHEQVLSDKSTFLVRGLEQSVHLGSCDPCVFNHTFAISKSTTFPDISAETQSVVSSIQQFLQSKRLSSTNIISSVILLRSMSDFQTINQIYSTIFDHPNPPSRVTISCGNSLPANQRLQIQLTFYKPHPTSGSQSSKALHVQSRSYWAPANIGPYSQAMSYASLPFKSSKSNMGHGGRKQLSTNSEDDEDIEFEKPPVWLVKIAGQIPLLPASMTLPQFNDEARDAFRYQAVLALQHLWRIGIATDVKWFVGGVAYIPTSEPAIDDLAETEKATIVSRIWHDFHEKESPEGDNDGESEDEIDVWDQRNNYSSQAQPVVATRPSLPDWNLVTSRGMNGETSQKPPVFTVQVESLPRESRIEWHAFAGIATGAIRIAPMTHHSAASDTDSNVAFTVHHIVTNEYITHTVVSVPFSTSYSSSTSQLDTVLDEVVKFLNIGKKTFEEMGTLTYITDKCVHTAEELLDVNGRLPWKGLIPCKAIWDAFGKEVAGLWALEGVLNISR